MKPREKRIWLRHLNEMIDLYKGKPIIQFNYKLKKLILKYL